MFAGEGFDRASMSALAEACDVSKGTLYHYYDGKHALLFDILDCHLRDIADRIEQAETAADPRASLQAIVLAILLAYRGADDEHRLQMNALSQLPDEAQERLRATQRQIVALVRERVTAAFPPLHDDRKRLHAVTMSLFGMLNWFYLWNREEGEKPRRDYAQLVTGLFLDGVGRAR